MIKNLFNLKKVKIWVIGVMIFYILLSYELCYFLRFAKSETQSHYLYFYAVFSQLFIYAFLYKALRDIKVYIFIFIIGVLHLYLFFILKENASLIGLKNNIVISLRNTIILLIIFKVLQFVSLKTQNQELVSIGRNNKDVYGTRYVTKVDYILEIIYITATFILLIK